MTVTALWAEPDIFWLQPCAEHLFQALLSYNTDELAPVVLNLLAQCDGSSSLELRDATYNALALGTTRRGLACPTKANTAQPPSPPPYMQARTACHHVLTSTRWSRPSWSSIPALPAWLARPASYSSVASCCYSASGSALTLHLSHALPSTRKWCI